MMGLAEIRELSRRAANAARRQSAQPTVWTGDREAFVTPFLGDYVPVGWRRTDRKPLFCDMTGLGGDDEPALSIEKMFQSLTEGKGYALIEIGQFQGYLAEYEKVNED